MAPAVAAPPAAASARPVPAACRAITVTVAFTPTIDPKTKLTVLNGTVTVANGGPYVAALQRVGVRLCSNSVEGHIRETAVCLDDDVAAGARLVCAWSIRLPGPPAAGAALGAWTGVLSSAQLSLDGERCPSAVVDPGSGAGNGTCNASAA